MRLLLVEDHDRLAEALQEGLGRGGFVVDRAASIAEARAAMRATEFDLALLDLGLPDGSGLELLAEWRATRSVPVIVLTARGALGDRIEGLDSGADDYIVKPVEIPELVSRCRAVLRRPGSRLSATLEAGDLSLDTVHREARLRGELLALGRREIGALEIMMRRKNHVVSRRALEDTLYSQDDQITPNAVDAAVSRLRRSLEAAEADVKMQTVRGIGWMLLEGDDQ